VPELELELALALTPLAEFREAGAVLEHAKRRAADPCLAARIRIANLHVRLSHDPERAADAIRRECAEVIPFFERRGDHRALSCAWFTLAEAEWFELQVDAATRAFEQAALHAGLAGDHARQLLALSQLTFYRGTVNASYAATAVEAEQLVALFHDDPIIKRSRDLGRAFLAYERGDIARARPLVRRAVAGVDRWGYPVIAAANKSYVGILELLNGQLDEAERFLLAAVDELEQHEERPYLSRVKAQLALLRVAQGRYREALELVDEARRLVGPSHPYGRVQAETTRARAHLGLGELDQAKAAAAEAVAVAETTDALDYHALAQLALAEVHAAAGELPAALEAAREAARIWATLDRKLLVSRAKALLEQLEHELTAAGAPA
jgi:ATP/maltotriose-dependent transcriptional regulator MalT